MLPSARFGMSESETTSTSRAARHLGLLSETVEAVTSSLDLAEVADAVAVAVARAFGTDACFVYVYDETTNELVLQAVHGTHVEATAGPPRMAVGEGLTGWAAATREPVAIAADTPHTEIFFAGTHDTIGPLGAKSQGECAINPVAPAVSNALANATGVRFAHLPFTPDRLFARLAAKS